MSLERAIEELRSEVDRRFAELAGALQRLTEAQIQTEERLARAEAQIERLAEAQQRTEARLEALAEAQRRTEARLEALAEAQRRTEARLEALAEAQRRTEARLEALAEAQRRTEARLEEVAGQVTALAREVRVLAGTVGDLLGWRLEANVRERPYAYLRRIISPVRVLTEAEILDISQGLGDEEVERLLLADLVAEGKHQGEDVYLVAEVGRTIRVYDVQRVARAARDLEKVTGKRVIGAVVGDAIRRAAAELADRDYVWKVIGRKAYPPGAEVSPENVIEGE